MSRRKKARSLAAGAAAGAVNGLFGAGGGMVLVPMLSGSDFSESEVFSSSVLIILPICLVSLGVSTGFRLPWTEAWPFLAGGIPGGIAAALLGKRIPLVWLHRFLGAMICFGGIRYLC